MFVSSSSAALDSPNKSAFVFSFPRAATDPDDNNCSPSFGRDLWPSRSARRPPSGKPIFSAVERDQEKRIQGSSKRPQIHSPSRLSSGSSLSCHVPASLAAPSSPTRRRDPCGGSYPTRRRTLR